MLYNHFSDLDQKLGDWNIPRVPTNQVYRSSSWSSKISFRTDYHVRTIEQVYSINKEYIYIYIYLSFHINLGFACVKLESFFNPTRPCRIEKLSTQPNSSYVYNWVFINYLNNFLINCINHIIFLNYIPNL